MTRRRYKLADLIAAMRPGPRQEFPAADPLTAYLQLGHKVLAQIAYAAHLYAYNTMEAGEPRVGAWNREEWLLMKRMLEEAGLNCTPA